MVKLLSHIQGSISATEKKTLPFTTAGYGLQQQLSLKASLLQVDQADKGQSPSVAYTSPNGEGTAPKYSTEF